MYTLDASDLLVLASVSMSLWMVELFVIVSVRLFQTRYELLNWWNLDHLARRRFASIIGLWCLSGFASIQRARASVAWMRDQWASDVSNYWYLPLGVFGSLWLLWWATAAVFGRRDGGRVWISSFVMGITLGIAAMLISH